MKKPALSFNHAIVLHSNKYNDNNGWFISPLFFSNLLQDVVFQFTGSSEKYTATLQNIQVPLYTQQEVTLISSEGNIFAYLDKATNNYYYLTEDFQSIFHLGIKIHWVGLIAMVFAISFLLSAIGEVGIIYVGYVWLILPIAWIYKRVYNGYLESTLDKYLKEEIK